MSVKIRKKGGKRYVCVHYRGKRKAKCIGTRAAAEQVKRTLEAKLALGDLSFITETADETFETYSQRWLKEYADVELKPSTAASYSQLLRLFVVPRFGSLKLSAIRRD